MKKLLLVDGSNLLFQMFFGIKLMNKRIQILYGFHTLLSCPGIYPSISVRFHIGGTSMCELLTDTQ